MYIWQSFANPTEAAKQKLPIREIFPWAAVTKPSDQTLLNHWLRAVQEEHGLGWRAEASVHEGTKAGGFQMAASFAVQQKVPSWREIPEMIFPSLPQHAHCYQQCILNEMDGLFVSKFIYLCGYILLYYYNSLRFSISYVLYNCKP